jgi:hypothetical protein
MCDALPVSVLGRAHLGRGQGGEDVRGLPGVRGGGSGGQCGRRVIGGGGAGGVGR